ncbi:MAG: acyl-CoA dehydrogenase, partial [Inquilinus sp.]|nr:acyl-CoA dehydrogenase [Inquilinus sp.]
MIEASQHVQDLTARLVRFMDKHVTPAEAVYAEQHGAGERWAIPPVIEELKAKARAEGLWNLFLPDSENGAGLSNLDYAPLCEIMGRSPIAPEVFNCNAPDTGNMEVLVRYGTEAQKSAWLEPLLAGAIRSCFAMTEPAVASSDATNIECRIVRDGDHYVVDGHKWWITGAPDPRCRIAIVMGKTDPSAPRHLQQSMILVPMDAPGVEIVRPLTVYGYDDAPHGHAELRFSNVRVPADNILLGEGRGFEIAQGRLGPGRIHHCMRLIGLAERALEAMCARVRDRVAFGRPLAEQGGIRQDIARSRIEIDQARLLTLNAAERMDAVGNKAARAEIAMIKVVAPNMALAVIDRAIQTHGAATLI